MNLDETTRNLLTPLTITVTGQWSPAYDMTTPMIPVDGQWVPAPRPDPVPIIQVNGEYIPALCHEWYGTATAAEPFVALTFHRTPDCWHWMKTTRYVPMKALKFALLHHYAHSITGTGYVVCGSVVPSPEYRPIIEEVQTFQTGVTQRFTQVEGEPMIDVSFLFLSRQDVRSTRFGLWRLRDELAETVTDPQMLRVLTQGRSGHFRMGQV